MKFETKYNIGDYVWTTFGKGALRLKVDHVSISAFKDRTKIEYGLTSRKKFGLSLVEEDRCFATKDDMIKTLGLFNVIGYEE